jgi:hypothetical protein
MRTKHKHCCPKCYGKLRKQRDGMGWECGAGVHLQQDSTQKLYLREFPLRRLTPAKIKALRKVKAHILQEPKRFAMGLWTSDHLVALRYDPRTSPPLEDIKLRGNQWNDFNQHEMKTLPSCGTVACIGGWLELLGGENLFSYDILWPLFSVERWPERLRRRYKKAQTPSKRAFLAGRALDEFIQLDGHWGKRVARWRNDTGTFE